MALSIRLYFKPFCSNYSNSGQMANRIRGDGSKHQLKQTVIGQIKKYGLIKAHPLSIEFIYNSIKPYPVHNYGVISQWILEAFLFAGVLQSIDNGVVAELVIRTRHVDSEFKEGCEINISRYVKTKQIS